MDTVRFGYDCKKFEESHNIRTVAHVYHAEHELLKTDRSKCTFRYCNGKYELGCKNTDCEWYENHESDF